MNGIVFSRFSTNAAFIKSGRKKTLVVAYLFSFGQAAEPLRSLLDPRIPRVSQFVLGDLQYNI
jgi:hypothetical protein